MSARTRPPRLIIRTLTATFVMVALLLVVVFVVVWVNVRAQVRQNVTTMLESSQRMFAQLESQRQGELLAQAGILAESPTLKAAIDTYAAEAGLPDGDARSQLLATIARELDKLAQRVESDVIVLVDTHRNTLASVGPFSTDWPSGQRIPVLPNPGGGGRFDGVVRAAGRTYRTVWVDLVLDNAPIGTLYIANLLDQQYAWTLAQLSNARIVIADGATLIASTLGDRAARTFEGAVLASRQTDGTVSLNGESFAFRRLVSIGDAGIYALGSIDASSAAATRQALGTMALIALGAGILALVGSLWLAHLLTAPIGRLSTSLRTMSSSRDARGVLPLSGSSRELDTLIETFNELMTSVTAAEAQTEAAYTGAIRALAAALDARDPYTAGHSERVSVLSVAMGRTLGLSNEDLEVLRLGALLHDIGKIGVPDGVLRKAGPLTDNEYDQIKQHPVLGARILRSVPFLAPHLPIVELHHERPDGTGYPYGLQSDATPLAARIVHVADAYDAMTSARAYRGARSPSAALHELWRCSGTAFDAALVEALTLSLPGAAAAGERAEPSEVHA